MDLFEEKGIKPMLISKQVDPFSSKDYLFELKQDGIRCINYVDKQIDLRNKRNLRLSDKFPELKDTFKNVKSKCILDGELIVLKNGVPDFYELQRRVMMSDPFKIKLASQTLPASYVAYDILYYKNEQITDYSLLKRKDILNGIIKENSRIAISRYIHEFGIELYNLTVEKKLEGVVAKEINSKYYFDKRSKDWLKIKRMADEDFIICGYSNKSGQSNTLILGQYSGTKLVYKGSVTFGVKLDFIADPRFVRIEHSPFVLTPTSDDDITWMEPAIVCVVEYMPNTKDALRQPIYKGIRDDVSAMDCQVKRDL